MTGEKKQTSFEKYKPFFRSEVEFAGFNVK